MFVFKRIFTSVFILPVIVIGSSTASSQEECDSGICHTKIDRVPNISYQNCPSDMVEIDGDFCPNVEQKCLNYDPAVHNVNGYVRCLEFAPTKCLSQKKIHMHFCIDRYEWPNKSGEKPAVMVSWNEAKASCENEGKRICWDHEWSLACEGPDMLPYPYGLKRDDNACNIDHPQRPGFDATKFKGTPEEVSYLDQRVPSASMPACVSPYGVYDMTGNVDESVQNSNQGQPMDPTNSHGRKQYKSAEMGGAWLLGHRARCRPKTTVHDESTVFYELGARCCKDISE